jgi:hypothetical protein
VYQAPNTPANLFCNDFGDIHTWESVIIDSNGYEMDPDFTVQFLYLDWVATLPSNQLPYWVPSINKYYMMSPSTFNNAQLCGSSGLQGLNSFGSPQSTGKTFWSRTGQEYTVDREAVSDYVLFCPSVLSDGVSSASSYGYTTLSDIPLLTVSTTAPVQLHKVRPQSAVMLHEILHMVSRWDGYGEDAVNGANMIVDHSCEYRLIIAPVFLRLTLHKC